MKLEKKKAREAAVKRAKDAEALAQSAMQEVEKAKQEALEAEKRVEEAVKKAKKAEEFALQELENANRTIIDSISTVSAISEEVAAHAVDTLGASEKNLAIVEDVIININSLGELSDVLRQKLVED